MSMKERLEKWRALWAKLTAEAEDEEYQDAATVICDRCGGRADADCAACPVRTGRPLHLQTDPDAALAPMPVMVPMKILDAAIEDLKCFSECEQCAHCDSENYQVCESADCVCDGCPDHSCPCYDCGHGSKWVWRGPRSVRGGGSMMMTELEIVSTFRQAKYPGKQVAILAELNDCTTEKIKEILLRNGVDQKNLPRKSRKMRQMEMDALVESSANEDTAEIRAANPVSAEIPASTEVPAQDETILDLIRREEAAVNAEHGSLSEQIVSLRTAQKTAERRLADIRTARRALERYFGLDVEPEENPDFYCSEGERSEVND